MTDPDGLLDFVQVTEKFNDVLVAVACEFLVRVSVDVLDVHEQKVRRFHKAFDFSKWFACRPERDAARVDARVDSRRFCGLEEFNHEVDLRQRFAAAYCNATVGSPVGLVAQGFFQQVFCRNIERSIRGSVCAFSPEIPRFWIVAELAAHGAALRKDDESNARSIDRTERFKLIDSSESHDAKIKNCVFVLRGIFCGVL